MTRAFISLYLLIVVSIIAIGWGLNALWDSRIPEGEDPSTSALFQLLEARLDGVDAQQLSAQVQLLGEQLSLSLDSLPLADMARSQGAAALATGQLLRVETASGSVWYKRLGQTDQLLLLRTGGSPQERHSGYYRLLLLSFYLLLALVVYLWVWPLARDAHRLEQQTRKLGPEGLPPGVELRPTSPLYPLARAFNQMAQRLRELLSSHRDMTNAVSHELRTPLARMKFALALLEGEPLAERSRRQLHSLTQDVAEMEALINSLLAYAGFERHSQALKRRTAPLANLGEIARQRFALVNSRALELQVVDQSTGAECRCEWKLMETLVANLLANAARFAHRKVRLELGLDADGYYLAVEDDGPGIAPADRARVFESFTRLDCHDQVAKAPGFGLGLAIVQRIIQWHGGCAEATEPEILGGARILIRWPDIDSLA